MKAKCNKEKAKASSTRTAISLSAELSPQNNLSICVPYGIHARMIQVVTTPHNVVNHSYMDYSRVPPDPEDAQCPSIGEMNFHRKVHHMLSRPEFSESICWAWHGRAFKIQIPSKFENSACYEYFGHRRYSSFLYLLGLHGYKQLSVGKDKGAYYSPVRLYKIAPRYIGDHEYDFFLFPQTMTIWHAQFLLRGLPHLAKYAPDKENKYKHLALDPNNEPDFHIIHLIAPLPSDDHFGKPLTIEDVIQFCRSEGRSETAVIRALVSRVPNKKDCGGWRSCFGSTISQFVCFLHWLRLLQMQHQGDIAILSLLWNALL